MELTPLVFYKLKEFVYFDVDVYLENKSQIYKNIRSNALYFYKFEIICLLLPICLLLLLKSIFHCNFFRKVMKSFCMAYMSTSVTISACELARFIVIWSITY